MRAELSTPEELDPLINFAQFANLFLVFAVAFAVRLAACMSCVFFCFAHSFERVPLPPILQRFVVKQERRFVVLVCLPTREIRIDV